MDIKMVPQESTQLRLHLTPELREAIGLLAMSRQELGVYIQEALEQNPCLEWEGDDGDTEESSETSLEEMVAWLDGEEERREGDGVGTADPDRTSPWERLAAPAEGVLGEGLLELLPQAEGPLVHILRFLVLELDEDGLLAIPLEEAAAHLGVSPAEVAAAQRLLLRTAEPAGVGAVSREEALQEQWRRLGGREGDVVYRLLDLGLGALARTPHRQLARQAQGGLAAVRQALRMIARLNPRPANGLWTGGPETAAVVRPDLVIQATGSEWVARVLEASTPRIRINPGYRRMLEQGVDEETRHYLSERMRSAFWLLRSLERRRQTLERVGEAILRYQAGFFREGVTALRPLTLRRVARFLGLHESTVSRAVADKWVLTPRGLLPLRFFFPSGVPDRRGVGGAAESVKRLIQELIDGEDSEHPYTDHMICERLRRRGLNIARRTVAKYREEMGALPSHLRRRERGQGRS